MAPDLSKQIAHFEAQYSENPESLVFARLADLYRKDGDPERALDVLEHGLDRHPDYLSAHIVRARCLRDIGRWEAAEEAFRHVLDLDSQNLVALRGLAFLARTRGDEEEAVRRYEQLLQVDPRNEEAREALEELTGEGSAEEGPAATSVTDEDAREGAPEAREGGTPGTGEVPEDEGRGEERPEAVAEDAGEEGDAWAFGLRDLSLDEEAAPEEPEPEPDDLEPREPAAPEPPEPEDVPPPEPEGPEAPSAEGPPGEPDDAGQDRDVFRLTGPEPGGAAGPEGGPERTREPETPREPGEGRGAGDARPDEAEPSTVPEEADLPLESLDDVEAGEEDEDLLTETLASLYETQGFYEEAAEMYRDLLEERPDDEALRARLERAEAALEEGGGTEGEPAVPPDGAGSRAETEPPAGRETPREGAEGGERTVGEHLRALLRGEASTDGGGDDGPDVP